MQAQSTVKVMITDTGQAKEVSAGHTCGDNSWADARLGGEVESWGQKAGPGGPAPPPGLEMDALSPVPSCDSSDPDRPIMESNSPASDLDSSFSSLNIDRATGPLLQSPGYHHQHLHPHTSQLSPSPNAAAAAVAAAAAHYGFTSHVGSSLRRQRPLVPAPQPGYQPSPANFLGGPSSRVREEWYSQQQPGDMASGGGGYPNLRLNLNLVNPSGAPNPSPRSSGHPPLMPSPTSRGGRPQISSLLSPSAMSGGRPPPIPLSSPGPAAGNMGGTYPPYQAHSPRFSQHSPRYTPSPTYHHYGYPPQGLPPSGLCNGRMPRSFMSTTPRSGMGFGRAGVMSPEMGMYSPVSSLVSSPTGSIDDVGFYMDYGGGSGPGSLSPVGSMRHGFGGIGSALEHEIKRCSNVVKKLCSAGNISEVFTVLEDMLSRGLAPDLKTVKTVMRTCVKKLAWRRALQLLHTPGLPLDVVVYTMAINTCGKAGEWEQGLRVLREMDEASLRDPSLTPNEVSYGTAISACGKAGRWELALMLLNEVKERGLVLNDVCYGGAIDACGRAGQWQEALKLLHEMTVEGVAPNEVCYNSAISACGKAGEWEKAVALLREMRERGLTPDELNYNSAISACGKAAQWAHAVRLLREMAVQGLTPDVVSYGAAIDACRKAGKFDRGLALLSEMKDVGLAPNEVCYHSAVTACSEAGRWSEALLVLSEMVKQGLKPDAISYNAAVEACAKAGKWDALVLLIQDIGREQGIGNLAGAGGVSDDGSPTGVEGLSFTLAGAASGASGQSGEGGEGGPLTSSSSSSGLPSDATALVEAVLNNGVATCAKYGNWELASTLLHEMEYRGLPPTSASYSAVIDSCARAHAWDLILSVFDALRTKQGLIPEASSYSAALKACCAKSRWGKAAQLLDEMATRGYTVDTHIYALVKSHLTCNAARDNQRSSSSPDLVNAADMRQLKPRLNVSTTALGEPLLAAPGSLGRRVWLEARSPSTTRFVSSFCDGPSGLNSSGDLKITLPYESAGAGTATGVPTPIGSPRVTATQVLTPQGSPRTSMASGGMGAMDALRPGSMSSSAMEWFNSSPMPVKFSARRQSSAEQALTQLGVAPSGQQDVGEEHILQQEQLLPSQSGGGGGDDHRSGVDTEAGAPQEGQPQEPYMQDNTVVADMSALKGTHGSGGAQGDAPLQLA